MSLFRYMVPVLWLSMLSFSLKAQQTGSLSGKVFDAETKETLFGANVVLVGTYMGTVANEDGVFSISKIKPGDYTVKITYVGYTEQQFTGIRIEAGKLKNLGDIKMVPVTKSLGPVTITGEKSIISLEEAESKVTIRQRDIQDMNVRDVQEILAIQAGVSKTPDGLQIRGARVYETQYVIDNISAADPLAGTGFGVNVASSAAGSVELITGGAGAEFGNGSAGVVSTVIKEGTESFEIAGFWQSDNLGLVKNQPWAWNTDLGELSIAGVIPGTKKKVTFFNNVSFNMTDEYFGNTANQLHSSLFANNDSLWAKRYSNNYTHTFKLAWKIASGTKLSFTNQHSLSVNQNSRSLQIVGFDAILAPGYQFERSLNLDNATTYTHQSNLTALNLRHSINKQWVLEASVGRLFTNLRADANGRPFRTKTVDRQFDEESIVTDPVEVFNPNDPVQYVLPGPGLVNNGGIAGQWHDHFAREYTLKANFKYYPKKKMHQFQYGWEHKFNYYQWVDVTRPWVGAPIAIDDSTVTPSISIGSSNDIWRVKPNDGGLFFTDKITYKGIIASLGLRFNYWAPGKFADEAVDLPNSPVLPQIREDYKNQTVKLFGMRYKGRFLPKINVSFPVTSNNTLYFNYSHSVRLPHPRFMYAGLDPVYQNRSFLSNLGNPNLNPEVNVSYEIGYKSQINKDLGISVTAYNNNRFDYIVSRRVIVNDATGRPVSKTMYINQDYAKILGLEFGIQQRVRRYMRLFGNVTYQVARGKSNSARESSLQIEQNGEVPVSTEQYLAWDRPWNVNLGVVLNYDSASGFFPKWTKGMQLYLSSSYQSGIRYTPQELEGYNNLGRPLYRSQNEAYLQERATPWFNTDLKINKSWNYGKEKGITLSLEARNLLNNKNAQIINPVTGRAYEPGDDVPNTWRDPRYIGPEESGAPSDNPARYLPPRQCLFGVKFRF